LEAAREFAKCIVNPDYDPGAKRREAELAKAAAAKKAADEKYAKAASDREAAAKLLDTAKTLDRASKTIKAAELYRRIVVEYPDTSAASYAEGRLKAMVKAKARR
jgi:hypothetical protein